jgi:hypothetical protein
MEQPRADSEEKHGPGRGWTRMIGRKHHAPNEWPASPSRSFEHLGARVPLARTTALSHRRDGREYGCDLTANAAATTATRMYGDAGFRPGRLRRAANFAAR